MSSPKQRIEKYSTNLRHTKDTENSFYSLKENLLKQVELLEQLHIAIYIKEKSDQGLEGILYQIKNPSDSFIFEYYFVETLDIDNFENSFYFRSVNSLRLKRFRVKSNNTKVLKDSAD